MIAPRILNGLALFAVGSLLACTAATGGTEDPEVSDNTKPTTAPIIGGKTATAYPEAALVDMYQSGSLAAYCSGSVIAPQVVLTAGHCVDGFDGWKITTPFASNQKANASSGTTYDWAEHGSETVNPNHHDIGLIFLDSAITLSSYPTLSSSKLADGSKIVNIGRIGSGTLSTTALYYGAATSITDATSSGFPYDYVSTDVIESGDSGGPDMVSGTHTIASVNSGAGGGTQVLARVDLLKSWIDSQVAAHGGYSGGGGGTPTPTPTPTPPPGGGGSCGDIGGATYTAAATAANGTQCGTFADGSDEDWFQYTIGSGVAYDIKVTGSSDAQVQMWKLVGGSYYNVANTSSTEVAHTSSGGGTYIFVVYSPSGSTGSYTLSVKH